MTQERRGVCRRQSDRELMERLRRLEACAHQADLEELRHLRRRAIRHHSSVHVAMSVGRTTGFGDTYTVDMLPIKGRLLDLSEQGASIFMKETLDSGQVLRLMLELEGVKPLPAAAQVRWIKAVPDKGGYAYGVQFAPLTPEATASLMSFLKKMDETVGL